MNYSSEPKLQRLIRNEAIYRHYNGGFSVKYLSRLYKLSVSSIYRIIRNYKSIIEEQSIFLNDLNDYLTKKCTTRDKTCIYNSMCRYINMYYLYTYDEISVLINDEKKYIRGIGKAYRQILKDFIKDQGD